MTISVATDACGARSFFLAQTNGLLRDTFLDGQRLGDAGVPRAPRLATTARARVVTLPVPDQHHPETLVAVEWVEALD